MVNDSHSDNTPGLHPSAKLQAGDNGANFQKIKKDMAYSFTTADARPMGTISNNGMADSVVNSADHRNLKENDFGNNIQRNSKSLFAPKSKGNAAKSTFTNDMSDTKNQSISDYKTLKSSTTTAKVLSIAQSKKTVTESHGKIMASTNQQSQQQQNNTQ